MAHNKMFSISYSAKFLRTTRDTLLYYDKIGLLSPQKRGDNNYRYYTSGQLGVANLIRTLQELGMTLSEIKEMKDHRTPESLQAFLEQQMVKIDSKIAEWVNVRKLLHTIESIIQSVSDIDEKNISIRFIPAEPIVLGGINDYSRGRNDYDALYAFYDDISRRYPDINLNYPVWGFFSKKRILEGDWKWPDRYYFYNPDGYDRKPASLYATAYNRGGYGQASDIYERLLKYIRDNGFEVSGDAYEEYPLNELSVFDDTNYLIRLSIAVREKGG